MNSVPKKEEEPLIGPAETPVYYPVSIRLAEPIIWQKCHLCPRKLIRFYYYFCWL
jgi:hypothetical protein